MHSAWGALMNSAWGVLFKLLFRVRGAHAPRIACCWPES